MNCPKSSLNIAAGLLALGVSALSLCMPSSTRAQVVGATLSGTVADSSGAVIPNAQLAIENVATGVVRTVTTDTAGFYTAPNLVPGSYQITATAPAFKTIVRTGVTLTVGAEQSLNIAMQVGQVSQTVEVTGEAPVVQLASSAVGTVVASETVVELPLNGRDWTQLTSLNPGVAPIYTQVPNGATAPRANRGFGAQLTIAGTRPQMNNYRVDGVSVVDYSGGSPGSVLAQSLGVDAIQEFSVITSNYSAEYGRTSGGVINAVTRSGTNTFHGDAYWFIRDEGLDARSYFDPAGPLPPFHRNQFGGSVGGPIRKDKTFFFVNYEGFRQAQTTTVLNNTPSTNARNGIISTAGAPVTQAFCNANFPGSTDIVPGQSNVCVSNAVVPFLKFWPVPTAAQLVGAGDIGKVPFGITAAGNEDFLTNRVDERFSEKDSVSGTWFYDNAQNVQPDPLDTVLAGNTSRRIMATVEETHVFSPSFVNTLRIGYSRIHVTQNNPLGVLNPLAGDTSGAVSAVANRPAPAITVSGIQTFLGGLGEASINTQVWNSYQLYDDAFKTIGAHSLKFGFNVENMRHSPQNITYQNASWFFNGGLGSFLENQANSVREPSAFYLRTGLRQTIFAGYAQDDWKMRSNLTLNLGLRYEAATVVSEAHGQQTPLTSLTATSLQIGPPLYHNNTLRDFEPRVGFAWDPFHTGKTSVRGAAGLFDVLPLIYDFFISGPGIPFAAPGVTLSKGIANLFPKVAALPNPPPGENTSGTFYQQNPSRNYVAVWNLNVQRQLTASTSVTIGYVGNHGVHMFENFGDIDIVVPTLTSAGLLFPGGLVNGKPLPGSNASGVGSGTPINPNLTSIGGKLWDGSATYNALEVDVQKRFSHSFQVQGSYTWGRNIDSSSAATISDPFVNSISSLIWLCSSCRRGLSDYNVSHRLSVNYLWNLPTPHAGGALVSHVLGGWEVGGIITAETGTPVTPLIGGDPQGNLNSDNPFQEEPNRLRTPGCSSLVNSGNVNNYIKLNCLVLPATTPAIASQCTPFGFTQNVKTGVVTNPGIAGTCANLFGNAGRNSVIGPGLFDYDFSLFKNNYFPKISESFNLQFRAEFFNVLNHPGFQAPIDNSTLFQTNGQPVAGAGALDALTVVGREAQLALKLIF